VTTLKGVVASQGKAKGRVRVILRESEFHRFQEGEILVTAMTRPEYVPLMRTAIAIVTDEGGLTSHAAIVSRELKKPCVIGTKSATQVFKDGDEVEVNAETGIITKLA
jgi:pyruvate,water dikinase